MPCNCNERHAERNPDDQGTGEPLKLAEKTVAMANADESPAFNVRGQWRVKRIDIERWMEQQVARRSKS